MYAKRYLVTQRLLVELHSNSHQKVWKGEWQFIQFFSLRICSFSIWKWSCCSVLINWILFCFCLHSSEMLVLTWEKKVTVQKNKLFGAIEKRGFPIYVKSRAFLRTIQWFSHRVVVKILWKTYKCIYACIWYVMYGSIAKDFRGSTNGRAISAIFRLSVLDSQIHRERSRH